MSSVFDTCAEEYDQYRPPYPDALFDDLLALFRLTPGSMVVDAGTGTGMAALPLAARGLRVVGLDPSPAMLNQARRRASAAHRATVEFRPGRAEDTGLPAGAAEAVIMAQAFHWVDPPKALAEFQRILRPGGGLAIFWNQRDLNEPYLTAMEALITRYNPKYQSGYRHKPWDKILAAAGYFKNVRYKQYRHASEMPTEAVVGLTRSFSYVRNVLSGEATAAFERELRALLASHTRAGNVLLPYLTHMWYAESTL